MHGMSMWQRKILWKLLAISRISHGAHCFECVGVEASLHNVIKATRPGAAVMIMGVFEKPRIPYERFSRGRKGDLHFSGSFI